MKNEQLEQLIHQIRPCTKEGHVATYIPELAKADRDLLGISVITKDGNIFCAGDHSVPFTIQSISKIASFICALQDCTLEKLSRKISVSTSIDGFNSIIALESRNEQRPLNPMINSGAIAAVSMVRGDTMDEKFQRIFTMIKDMTENKDLKVNQDVYHSEIKTGNRNRALAYFMRSTGIIETDDIEGLLEVYFRLCSIEVTCDDIAKMALTLALDGYAPDKNNQLFDMRTARITKAVMSICGMYDASGDFAVSVGMPGKSGVGGGIIAVSPKNMGIGVFGPSLDEKGNSLAGWKLLEILSEKYDLNIF